MIDFSCIDTLTLTSGLTSGLTSTFTSNSASTFASNSAFTNILSISAILALVISFKCFNSSIFSKTSFILLYPNPLSFAFFICSPKIRVFIVDIVVAAVTTLLSAGCKYSI